MIDLSAELYIASGSSEGAWQFAATGPNLIGFIGGINLVPHTATDETISLITSGSTAVGGFTLNTWNNVDFLFNMTTQTYSFSLNGSLIQSGIAFCGSNAVCPGATVSSYGDTFFDVFGGTGGDTDSGFIDNVSVTGVSGVPEPASSFLLSSVGLLLARGLPAPLPLLDASSPARLGLFVGLIRLPVGIVARVLDWKGANRTGFGPTSPLAAAGFRYWRSNRWKNRLSKTDV